MERKTLEFGELPLAEVAIRLTFQDRPIPASFAFHHSLANSLEKMEGRTWEIVGEVPGEVPPGLPFDNMVLGGLRFQETETGVNLTVQGNMVAVQWFSIGSEYPRFPALQETLDLCLGSISKIVGAEIVPHVANVAYANDIRDEEVLAKLFSKSWQVPALAAVEGLYHSETIWPEDRMDVRVTLNRDPAVDQKSGRCVLVTSAGMRLDDGDVYADKVEQLHDRLIDLFDQLASDEVKSRWKQRQPL